MAVVALVRSRRDSGTTATFGPSRPMTGSGPPNPALGSACGRHGAWSRRRAREVGGYLTYSRLVDIAEFQDVIARTYGERDRARGTAATVAWLCEELGELAQAVRKGTVAEQRHELSDVLAWLASLAHQLDLSLDEAASRYAAGCPRCAALPCACP